MVFLLEDLLSFMWVRNSVYIPACAVEEGDSGLTLFVR